MEEHHGKAEITAIAHPIIRGCSAKRQSVKMATLMATARAPVLRGILENSARTSSVTMVARKMDITASARSITLGPSANTLTAVKATLMEITPALVTMATADSTARTSSVTMAEQHRFGNYTATAPTITMAPSANIPYVLMDISIATTRVLVMMVTLGHSALTMCVTMVELILRTAATVLLTTLDRFAYHPTA
jgi:hypothetical protein